MNIKEIANIPKLQKGTSAIIMENIVQDIFVYKSPEFVNSNIDNIPLLDNLAKSSKEIIKQLILSEDINYIAYEDFKSSRRFSFRIDKDYFYIYCSKDSLILTLTAYFKLKFETISSELEHDLFKHINEWNMKTMRIKYTYLEEVKFCEMKHYISSDMGSHNFNRVLYQFIDIYRDFCDSMMSFQDSYMYVDGSLIQIPF